MDTEPSNASPDLRSKTPPGSPTLYPDLSKMIAPEKAVDVTNNPENGKRTTPVKNGAVSPADYSLRSPYVSRLQVKSSPQVLI